MKNKGGVFFFLVLFFLLFGLLMIGDVSLLEGERNFGDKFYFFKHQLIWGGGGLILALVISLIDYHLWRRLSFFIYLFSLFLLILVLIPGVGISAWGARRWLNLGFFRFQPSEIAKLGLLLYLSSLLEKKEQLAVREFFLLLLLPVGLTLLEPDFGTAAIMVAIGLTIYFLAGIPAHQVTLPSVILFLLGVGAIIISPYRRERVLGLLDPFYDPLGKSYHAHQLILTLGSGGVWGIGMGKSRQKYLYLPQVTTDSIMAVVAEEFGLVGITLFIILFLVLILTGLKIAFQAQDKLGQLIAGGIVSWLAIQGLINLSAVAVLLPLTGVPFPFVSYGGSSLIALMIAVGIILNISRKK